jgi:hypothetical protein
MPQSYGQDTLTLFSMILLITPSLRASIPFNIGILMSPAITQFDLIGPYEVFTKFYDEQAFLVPKTLSPPIQAG